ncbi:MAG: hypothetical protein JW862_17750 [Anaerolineales bacterium]|nr:hypothetical protein [Anaerolineales bacterium]
MIHIQINDSYARWQATSVETPAGQTIRAWACGYAWRDGELMSTQALMRWAANLLQVQPTPQQVRAELAQLNGSFSLIVRSELALLATVDHFRSTPLFYAQRENELMLSDQVEPLRSWVGDQHFAPIALKEFMLTPAVTGPETLFPHVRQLQAGEALYLTPGTRLQVQTVRHHEFILGADPGVPETELQQTLFEIFKQAIERMLATLPANAQIVLPLSGGRDSRSIAAMLKYLAVENVLCFTYGARGDWEAEIAQEVAGRLGFPWHFVPYSRQDWRRWYQDPELHAVLRNTCQATSLPLIQDWPAVNTLQQSGLLTEQAVFVPGHTPVLGMIGFPERLLTAGALPASDIANEILKKHYSRWNWQPGNQALQEIFLQRILSVAQITSPDKMIRASCLIYPWEYPERQSKFVVNSVRVYESFGYDWRIPWWDREILDFWLAVPPAWRKNRWLGHAMMENILFAATNVAGLYTTNGPRGALAQPATRKMTLATTDRIRNRLYAWSNPSLGRYSMPDFFRSWQHYQATFGNLAQSKFYLLDALTVGTSYLLKKFYSEYLPQDRP